MKQCGDGIYGFFLPSLTKKWLERSSSFIHAMLNITKTMLPDLPYIKDASDQG
jgi:hypothetical protein